MTGARRRSPGAAARLPRDDLFCGPPATYEVRFASAPITSPAAFAAATVADGVSVELIPAGDAGSLTVTDARFAGQAIHLGMVATDDAGNRSTVVPLGSVSFVAATPTPAPRATDDAGCQTNAGQGASWPLLVLPALWAWRRLAPWAHTRLRG